MRMGWQDIAVALVLCGAIAFLLRRMIGRRRAKRTAHTFVPLSSLKRPAAKDGDDRPSCH